jgi:hypothetical protein
MKNVHAPDGGMIPGSLCEQDGDTTIYRDHVDCPDCLDILDGMPGQGSYDWAAMVRTTEELRSLRWARSTGR